MLSQRRTFLHARPATFIVFLIYRSPSGTKSGTKVERRCRIASEVGLKGLHSGFWSYITRGLVRRDNEGSVAGHGRSGKTVGYHRPWVMVEDRRLASYEGSEYVMMISQYRHINVMAGERSRAA